MLFGTAGYRKMIHNLIWAIGYNVVALPLAVRSFIFNVYFINPAAGAVLMTISTIEVAIIASQLII